MENIIIKLVKEPYGRDKDIQNLFCYIAGECDSKEEHTRYCCGEGGPLAPGKAARRMISVQKSFGKARRKYGKKASRRIYHYIVSFPLSMDDANCVKLVAMEIADIFSGQYQVYYGIHEDEAHLHIHYAINAVSYVDGKKWHKSRKEIEKLEAQMRERAKEVLRR